MLISSRGASQDVKGWWTDQSHYLLLHSVDVGSLLPNKGIKENIERNPVTLSTLNKLCQKISTSNWALLKSLLLKTNKAHADLLSSFVLQLWEAELQPPTGKGEMGSSTNQQVQSRPDTSYLSFSRFKADKVNMRMPARMSRAQFYSNISLMISV